MSLYDRFKMNPDALEKGVWLEFETTRIRLARAGEGNKKFEVVSAAVNRKHARAIAKDLLTINQQREIQFEIFAEAVVTEWEYRENENSEWKPGIEQPDGSAIPPTKENIIATWRALPDLFLECRETAMNDQLYRASLLEGKIKN